QYPSSRDVTARIESELEAHFNKPKVMPLRISRNAVNNSAAPPPPPAHQYRSSASSSNPGSSGSSSRHQFPAPLPTPPHLSQQPARTNTSPERPVRPRDANHAVY